MNDIYQVGGYIVGLIVFVGSYIYCIATYGFLLGVGLGWLPSLIVAALAAALWPLLIFALIAFFWVALTK